MASYRSIQPKWLYSRMYCDEKAVLGVDGIFLDNAKFWNESHSFPFLRKIRDPLKQVGLMLMANAMADSSSTGADQDDGSADRECVQGHLSLSGLCFMEYWMMGRGGPLKLKLRLKGGATYADNWEGWIQNPKAIHDLGCKVASDCYSGLSNAIYARASLLLVAGPGDTFAASFATTTPDGPDPYDSRWMKTGRSN